MGFLENLSDRMDKKSEHYGYLQRKGRIRIEVERSIQALAEAGIEFDAIAVQGVSGLLLGAPLAAALDKGLIIVRRTGDASHFSPFGIQGHGKNQSVLFLDDCVRTGATLRRVLEKLDAFCNPYTLAGALFYNVGWRGEYFPKTFTHSNVERPVIVLPDETPPFVDKESGLGVLLKSLGGESARELLS